MRLRTGFVLLVLSALSGGGCGGEDDDHPTPSEHGGKGSQAGNGGRAGRGGSSGTGHAGKGVGSEGATGGEAGASAAGDTTSGGSGNTQGGGTGGSGGGAVGGKSGAAGDGGTGGTSVVGGTSPGGGAGEGAAGEAGTAGVGGEAGTGEAGTGAPGSGGSATAGGTGGAVDAGGTGGTGGAVDPGGTGGTSSSGTVGTGGVGGASGSGGQGGTIGVGGSVSGAGGAVLADPCDGVTCSGHGACASSGGVAACTCSNGYAPPPNEPLACADVDECGLGACDPLTACDNREGGYSCGACPPDYTGTGASGCVPNTCNGVPTPGCACLKVSVDGDDAAAAANGSVTSFATIQAAIDFADEHPTAARKVCVANGPACSSAPTYVAPHAMRNGVSVFGGFAADTWIGCDYGSLSVAEPIVFDASVQSRTVLDNFVVTIQAPADLGVLVQGATGVEVSRLRLAQSGDVATSTGIDIVRGSVTVADTNIYVKGLKEAQGIHSIGAQLAYTNGSVSAEVPRVENDVGGIATGLWLEQSSDVVLAQVVVYARDLWSPPLPPLPDPGPGGNGSDLSGIFASGSGDFTFTGAANVIGRRGAHSSGLVVAGFATATLDVEVETASDGPPSPDTGPVPSASSPVVFGISVDAATADIRASVQGWTWDGNVHGIACTGDCSIHDSSVTVSNAARTPSAASNSIAASCAGTTCSITDSDIRGPPDTTCYRTGTDTPDCKSWSRGLTVNVSSSALVAGNRILSGKGLQAIGLDVTGTARIENNVIFGQRSGQPTDQYSYAVQLLGDVELHSNSINPAYHSRTGRALCTSAGVVVAGGHPTVRNNILGGGDCPTHHHFVEAGADSSPATFQNNAFLYDEEVPLTPGTLYYGRLVTTVDEINALTDMLSSGNLFSDRDCVFPLQQSSSCVDAGTPQGAPAEDIDGDTRVALPDIGADEFRDLCDGVTCNGAGDCGILDGTASDPFYPRYPYCYCDAGYHNAVADWQSCIGKDACLSNPAVLECVDIDECATGNGGCDPLTACNNFPGGHSCGPCPDEYDGTGETGCRVPAGHFVQLSAGGSVSCGVRENGRIDCWGNPPYFAGLPADGVFRKVSAKSRHVCGLDVDGRATCWGEVSAVPPTNQFEDLSAGGDFDCALAPDHDVVCWGSGSSVTNVPNEPFATIASGGAHVCGLRADGTVTCWGENWNQQLAAPGGTFKSLCAGSVQSCGVRSDGTLACWGDVSWLNDWRPPPSGTFESVYCGDIFACALDSAGALACWGQEYARVPPSGPFKAVALGTLHGCALRTDDEVVCWGLDNSGETSPPD